MKTLRSTVLSTVLLVSGSLGIKLVPFGFSPVVTPNAIGGTGPGVTQILSFVASHSGSFILACLVPGHVEAGMWDHFIVSNTAKLPSIAATK